jgi:LuxR family maltose regulon positive regulatory protein
LIDRPDLVARLKEGSDRRLTLISAPAGSGKTTLLAQWADQTDRRCAWLSLDETDSDLPSWMLSLLGALRTIQPAVGLNALRMLRGSTSPSPGRLAAALSRDLEDAHDPALLVLDNFELVQDVTVHEFTAAFLRHLPPSLHLVIASRSDPPLPLARWRAAGQVSEFRAADLYFSPEESAKLLQSVSRRPLSPQVIAAIVGRSEGWPAGLRLAAMSLSGTSSADVDRLPTGRSRLVMDYFLEEVLAQTGPEIIGTLLRSSILRQLSVPVVSAVNDIPVSTAARFLEYLERNNLFVVALEGREGWFRLHPLLRETLRSRLETVETGAAIARFHRRAADWFSANGHVEQAIRHSLSAGDVEHACEMAEAELLLALGSEDLLEAERRLRLIPESAIRQRPLLLAIQARLVGGRTGWHGVLPMLDAAEAILDRDGNPDAGERGLIARGLIDAVRAPVYFFGGNTARSLECAERARKALRDRFSYGAGWAGYFAGVSHYLLGRPQQGLKTLAALLTDGQNSGDSLQTFFGLFGLAVTHLFAARLPESERAAAEMLALETAAGRTFGMAWSHYLLGALAYETNRLPEAMQHFDMTIALHQEVSAFTLNDAMLGAALARQALGMAAEASDTLNEAEELIFTSESVAFLPALHSVRARTALMRGDVISAQTWTQATPMRMSPGPLLFMEVPPLTAANVLLADAGKQAARDALALIAHVEERCRAEHNLRYTVSVLALEAMALARLGRTGTALEKLSDSVDLARRGGFIRSFVDLGPPMAALLQSLARRTRNTAYVDRLLAAFAVRRLEGGGQTETIPVESLTQRELEILPLLQRRYTNEEIAGELGISILTVKRHTGSLYAKLQASGRRDAVRRATSLGLLAQSD